MAKYVNINTSATAAVVLLQKNTQDTGKISKIHISNNRSAAEVINVYLESEADASNDYYFIKGLSIPANTSFLLEDCLSFDISLYKLKIDGFSASNDLTVIIK